MPYYFNLPIITQLTTDQQAAVDETDPLALSGGPGTGKSVVCLWRHIRNHSTGTKNSLLLTYTKTLEHYLRESSRRHSSSAAESINRIYWWLSHNATNKFDEIIVDEGQDVPIGKFNRIKSYANEVSYGADEAQSVYDGCTPQELQELFPDNEEYNLQRNFRNSKEILEFIRTVFPNILIPQNSIDNAIVTGLKPIVKITGWNDDEKEIKCIMDIIEDFARDTENIGILVPIQKHVSKYYNFINSRLNNLECSQYKSDDSEFNGLSGIHITTFKSSKGTEFDTVIIPNFDAFDWYINKGNIPVTKKDYYVALTRTKKNLFLISKKNPNKGAYNTYEIEQE